MKIEEYVIAGRSYEFDCEYLTSGRRRTEMVSGVVESVCAVGDDIFVILDGRRALNTRAITRVVGPYPEVK